MGICSPMEKKQQNDIQKKNINQTQSQFRQTNINNYQKLITNSNKEEEEESEEIKSPQLPRLRYRPSIYIEKIDQNNPIRRLERRKSLNPLILQNRPIVRTDNTKITFQRRQSIKYCIDFKNNNEYHKNFLIRHLIRQLTENNNNNDELFINKKADFPEYMINYKLVNIPETENYTWKNMGLIKINEDLINEIMKMSIEEAKNCEFLYKKRIWLHCFLHQNIIDLKKDNPTISICRNNILEDSFNQFMNNKINLKKPLKIKFLDEAKQDENGVYREWYSNLFKDFFKEKNKLFIQNPNKTIYNGTFIINEFCDKNKFDYYEFFGKLLVKAIIDNAHMREHINMTLIKYLLNLKVNLEDMKFFDLSVYNSLKKIVEEKIENNESLKQINFTYNLKDKNGNINTIEIIPEGKYIYLNEQNKNTFIEKYIYYETYYKYKEQIEKIKKGFYSIVDDFMGKFYTPQEFDFEIVGMKIVDLEDWKSNTIYKGQYNKDNETIKLFWDALSNLKQEDLMIFFEFCTGLCNVPVDGFGSLKGIGNKIQKFTIEPLMTEFSLNDDPNQFKLIEARTCVNRILLPEYKSKEDMEKAIKIIIENDTAFFGLE